MKILVFLLISSISVSIGQTLIPYYQDSKYGYCDLKKQIMIKPQYDGCGFFNEGLAWFKKGTKFGYLNSTGKIIVEPNYSSVSNYKQGTAIVYDGVNYYVIDSKGKKFNKKGFAHAFRVADSLIACDDGYDFWKIINKKGKTIYEFEMIDLNWDNMDYISINDSITNKYVYFNLITGKTQVDKPQPKFGELNPKGLKIVQSKPTSHSTIYDVGYGLINSKGDTLVPTKYDTMLRDFYFNFFAYHTLKITNKKSQIYIANKNKRSKFIDAYVQNIEFEQNQEAFGYQKINDKYYFLCELNAEGLPYMQYYICIDEDGNIYADY